MVENVKIGSEEYLKYIKDEKEELLHLWEKNKQVKEDISLGSIIFSNGETVRAMVDNLGGVFVKSPTNHVATEYYAVYSSIDSFILHFGHSEKKNIKCNLDAFLTNVCNFDDPRKFFLEEFDGTGLRPGPFGPRGWHNGIIVCSSKQIQELRKRLNKGEPFTEELVLEINPLAIYKKFEYYAKFHKSAWPIMTPEIRTFDKNGKVILSPDRPKWITEQDWEKSQGEMALFLEQDEIEEFKDWQKARGVGYESWCKRHNIELWIPQEFIKYKKGYEEKIKEKMRKQLEDEEYDEFEEFEEIEKEADEFAKRLHEQAEKAVERTKRPDYKPPKITFEDIFDKETFAIYEEGE